jgi:hypothetical protein
MITIIYNHKEKSMREQNSKSKGMLNYHKEDKTFSCEASDLDCAGVPDIPKEFFLEIEENHHRIIFQYAATKRTKDEDAEIEFWLFKSKNMGQHNKGFNFVIFND